MLVLHASVDRGTFLLWGEAPAQEAANSEGTRDARALRRCPFDPGVEQLQAVLRENGLAAVAQAAEPDFAWAVLPTRARKPIPSSGLIDENADFSRQAGLGDWDLAVLQLPIQQAIELLNATSTNKLLAPGVVVGDDLRFWWYAFTFAAGLVVRQSYLPGIRRSGAGAQAVWEPVIAGADLEKFLQLAQAAPDSCRSVSLAADDAGTPPSKLQVVHQFIGGAVDSLVRASLPTSSPPVASRTAGDAWLRALRSRDRIVTADSGMLDELQESLAKWKRPIVATLKFPFRLCFRLEEPEPDPQTAALLAQSDILVERTSWRISYLLQSTTDQSLLIDANSVWQNDQTSRILQRTKYSAREYLLASLGSASMLYPPVERSLLSPAPASVEIDVEEAYKFLTHHAEMLRQAGFGVLLPAWWTPKGRKRLKVRVNHQPAKKMKGQSKLSLDSLIDFQWQVALGERRLSKSELEELAKLKIPLVQVRGQWVELEPGQLETALDFLKKSKQTLTLRQVLYLNFGGMQLPAGIEFGGVTGDGLAADLIEHLEGDGAFAEIEVPAQFHGTLRSYQLRGYSWLDFLSKWGLGACLADDMGLGKTVQTLALLQKNWQQTPVEKRRPVLLVCPMSVVGNWQKEAQRFTPDLPVLVHHGVARTKGELFSTEAHKHAIVITSYALLHRDRAFLESVYWSGVVLDEAQNIKNAQTRQAKAATALPADYKIALTGTPVENNVGDLWSIMQFLNPGLLGSASKFKQRFLNPIQVDRDEGAAKELKRITQPFVLRRVKTDKTIIKDLPDKIEMKDFCNLTREQASLYRAVLRDLQEKLASVEGIERRGLVLATLSKLKQICNHPAQFLHDNSAIAGRSGKLQRLTEMLEEALQVGDRILIFTQFAEMGEIIKQHLQNQFGQEVLFLHGELSKAKRDAIIERFQNEANGPQVFVLSLKAGGTGLNLTRANQVFHFDRWWNPAVENQATDRAFRIGQTRQVNVHKFVCMGTVEESIDQMIEEKQQLAQSIVGAGESWLTELSNDQLRQLFALRETAVSE